MRRTKADEAMTRVEERLQRLEEQNARILALLEEIAASSIHYRGKKLPVMEPDFAAVEASLRAVLAAPDAGGVVGFDGFDAKQWLCQARLRHQVTDISQHWGTIERVVSSVATQCGVPGRVAGEYRDPNDRQRTVGEILEFGYSPEVGYDHPNEFFSRLSEKEATGVV